MKRINWCSGWTFRKKDGIPEEVMLPHDATILEERSADSPSGTGTAFFNPGYYIYEKTFTAPAQWAGQDVVIRFEGVYPAAQVYLNETLIGTVSYGYSEYHFPLTGLNEDAENTLRVEVDGTDQPNSRWYAGAGIYRPISLLIGAKEHIVPDGVRVSTVSIDPAVVHVEVEHTAGDVFRYAGEGAGVRAADAEEHSAGGFAEAGRAAADAESGETGGCRPPSMDDYGAMQVRIEVYEKDESGIFGDGCGRKVAEAFGDAVDIAIPDAKLWSAEHPFLYECTATLLQGGEVIDEERTAFGIRMLFWSTEGFFVNGENTLLKGGCLHHDNGILGARTYKEAELRRIRKLKAGGFNAIRSAHNPLCRYALEACDEAGMYVMDEAWDMWDKHKNPGDYASRFTEHYEEDLIAMTRKDYNHPSVIMYSIGNEVTEPARPEGVALAARIVDTLKACDSTRPVTAGLNLTLLFLASLPVNPMEAAKEAGSNGVSEAGSEGGGTSTPQMSSTEYNKMIFERGNSMTRAAAMPQADAVATPVLDLLDIQGYNYASSRYEMEGELHPERILVGSETYPYELPSNWRMVERIPYLIGDFMWTCWDHIGETGIGSWSYDPEDLGFTKNYPWLLSGAGAYDILGDDTAEAGLAAVIWGARTTPYIGVRPVNHPGVEPSHAMWRSTNAIPHWSWKGCDGNEAVVEVYSTGAEAELYVNGELVGRRAVSDEYMAEFHTIYQPGEVRAVAYDHDGNEIGESILRSADENTRITIMPEAGARIGGLLYVNIDITGENGIPECSSDTKLSLEVQGARLLAFGSANPKTEELYNAPTHTTYYGRSQAILLVEEKEVCVTAAGEGLATQSLVITAE